MDQSGYQAMSDIYIMNYEFCLQLGWNLYLHGQAFDVTSYQAFSSVSVAGTLHAMVSN